MSSEFRPKSSTFFRVHCTLVRRIYLGKKYIYWWVWLSKEEFFYHHRWCEGESEDWKSMRNWVKIENAMTLFYVDVSRRRRKTKKKSSREKAYHASFIAFKRCWHIKSLRSLFPTHFFRRRMSGGKCASKRQNVFEDNWILWKLFGYILSSHIHTTSYRIKSLVLCV